VKALEQELNRQGDLLARLEGALYNEAAPSRRRLIKQLKPGPAFI